MFREPSLRRFLDVKKFPHTLDRNFMAPQHAPALNQTRHNLHIKLTGSLFHLLCERSTAVKHSTGSFCNHPFLERSASKHSNKVTLPHLRVHTTPSSGQVCLAHLAQILARQ
eukprot:392188-Hanusia_phi.AAC.2